jgi:hypothetical protein
MEEKISFDFFKSEICHNVKRKGDLDFIKDTLISNEIRELYDKELYDQCFYLLAMVDYLSKENNIPLYNVYNDIRHYKLDKMIYPSEFKMLAYLKKSEEPLRDSLKKAIPEFLKYGIVEAEIRDVY